LPSLHHYTTIRIEVLALHPTLKEILGSRTVLVNASCWGNYICGNTVTKVQDAIGILHYTGSWRIHGHVLEIQWLMNVSRTRVP